MLTAKNAADDKRIKCSKHIYEHAICVKVWIWHKLYLYIFIDETLKLFCVSLTVKCFLFYLYLLMLSKESLIIILICCVYFNSSIKIRFSYITRLINAFSLNLLIFGNVTSYVQGIEEPSCQIWCLLLLWQLRSKCSYKQRNANLTQHDIVGFAMPV